MLKKDIYINGFSSINPITDNVSEKHVLRCVEPDYKTYIDTNSVRRLGKIQKMSLVAAKLCLENAKIEVPDAIITGTGLGCLSDTEKFLGNMLDDETGLHSPTSFIQSTHNTISGQIAIMLKCYGYNNTYSHRSLSFERALEDACILLDENIENIVVGAVDEIPENPLLITQKIRTFYSESHKDQPIAGEGVHFFSISHRKQTDCCVKLTEFSSIDGHANYEEILLACHTLLSSSGISESDIDSIVLGSNQGITEDHYQQLSTELFPESSVLHFKHLTGECFTASAFGVVLACKLLQKEEVDPRFYLKKTLTETKNVLVYNQFKGISHSFFLLQHV